MGASGQRAQARRAYSPSSISMPSCPAREVATIMPPAARESRRPFARRPRRFRSLPPQMGRWPPLAPPTPTLRPHSSWRSSGASTHADHDDRQLPGAGLPLNPGTVIGPIFGTAGSTRRRGSVRRGGPDAPGWANQDAVFAGDPPVRPVPDGQGAGLGDCAPRRHCCRTSLRASLVSVADWRDLAAVERFSSSFSACRLSDSAVSSAGPNKFKSIRSGGESKLYSVWTRASRITSRRMGAASCGVRLATRVAAAAGMARSRSATNAASRDLNCSEAEAVNMLAAAVERTIVPLGLEGGQSSCHLIGTA